MFSLRRPTQTELHQKLDRARNLPISYGIALNTEGGPEQVLCPKGFVRDYHRSQIGQGVAAFAEAKEILRHWLQFDLGWVRVANPEARIEQEQIVAVEVHIPGFSRLGLWSLNLSRILYVIDEDDRFGFGYGTTSLHAERGEERFLIEFYPVSGAVYYDLLAVSQPALWLARLAYPYTRSRQHKFAHDSHRKMKSLVSAVEESEHSPRDRW